MVVSISAFYAEIERSEAIDFLVRVAKNLAEMTENYEPGFLESSGDADCVDEIDPGESFYGVIEFVYYLKHPELFDAGCLQNGRMSESDGKIYLHSGDLRFSPMDWIGRSGLTGDEIQDRYFGGITAETYGLHLTYGEQQEILRIDLDNNGMEFRTGERQSIDKWVTALRNFHDDFIRKYAPKEPVIRAFHE